MRGKVEIYLVIIVRGCNRLLTQYIKEKNRPCMVESVPANSYGSAVFPSTGEMIIPYLEEGKQTNFEEMCCVHLRGCAAVASRVLDALPTISVTRPKGAQPHCIRLSRLCPPLSCTRS